MENNPDLRDDIEQYEDEPVYYCKNCHSLYVIMEPELAFGTWDGSYCGKCSSANIGLCSMEEWLEEEKKRESIRKAKDDSEGW